MEISKWLTIAEQNREVDFFYKGKKYSISINQYGQWFLTQYGACEDAQQFDSFLELIEKAVINNVLFKEICEEVEVDMIY